MRTNSVRTRLLTTVPHLHFPLGFAHLGDEKPPHWHRVAFKDGVATDIHSEAVTPTMAAMIRAASRLAVKEWEVTAFLRGNA